MTDEKNDAPVGDKEFEDNTVSNFEDYNDDEGGFYAGQEEFDQSPVSVTVANVHGKPIPYPVRYSPHTVFDNILRHNSHSQYTGVMICGMSGTGKTTLVNLMIHNIVCVRGEEYVVRRFTGEDLHRLDEIIASFQVGVNHIVVFDDASYSTDDIDNKTLKKLAYELTVIRHKVKAKVISVMMIHYSKAMFKFFRGVPFSFFTSVNAEELGNYQDLYKSHTSLIRSFSKIYKNMTLKGHFQVSVNSYDGTVFRYGIDKPFRIGMVEEASDLHFFLYYKDSCAKCNPDNHEVTMSPKEIAGDLLKRYPFRLVNTPLAYFTAIRHGQKKGLVKSHEGVYHYLNTLSTKISTDWLEVLNEVRRQAKAQSSFKIPKNTINKRSRSKKNNTKTVMELIQNLKEEQEDRDLDKSIEDGMKGLP